jgi:hypothetical protein
MSNGPSKLDEIRFHMDMPEFHAHQRSPICSQRSMTSRKDCGQDLLERQSLGNSFSDISLMGGRDPRVRERK